MEKQKKQILGPKTIALLFVIVVLIAIVVAVIAVEKIQSVTEFALLGEENIILEVGTEYKEAGFVAKCNGTSIEDKIKVTSNLNTNVVGNYIIGYNLNIPYLGIRKTLTRSVKVVDTIKPVLKIDGKKDVTLDLGEKYTYPTYTATDNYDGDITKKVKVDSKLDINKIGKYTIKYSIKDSNGNEVTDKVTVTVKKKKNPYVVVSISKQTLSYYEYDKLVLSSAVVTGINGKTPTGTFKVLNKATNIILKGADYQSFVNYWIAFKGNSFGFHDASWRSYFGGTIYKTNGSHGCVNMPYAKVRQLYNMIEIGTPVYIKP